MSSSPSNPDVIVIGAGLAGLTAAVTLASAGRSVTVLERLPRAGGLCGSFEHDGHSFVRACNEFGGGVPPVMAALGVGVTFEPSSARVFIPEGPIHVPPTAADGLVFARHAPGLLRFLQHARRPSAHMLSDALAAPGTDPWVRSLFGFVSGAAATPAERLRLVDFVEFVRGGFGWHAPVKALGGPDAVIAGLVARLSELGGRVRLSTEVTDVRRQSAGFRVQTPAGELRAQQVVTSAPRWSDYPAEAPEGLWYGTALLRLADDVAFPGTTSTVHYVPRDALAKLEHATRGQLDRDFSFLLTRQLGPAPATGRTLVAFIPVPTALWEFDDAVRERIEAHVRRIGEWMLPGLTRQLVRLEVVSPSEFASRHGFPPRGMVRTLPAGLDKPTEYNPATGLYHVGVSVGPAGADGAAAVFSGRRVGLAVASALSGR